MKKNHPFTTEHIHPVIPKLLRIMKLSFCCMLLMSFSLSDNGFSQDAKVTLSIRNVKLVKMIEKQTEHRFAFSNDIIPEQNLISIHANSMPVFELLDNALAPFPLKNRFIEDVGIIVFSEKGGIKNDSEVIASAKEAPLGRIVIGRVLGEQGEPLEGVSVSVKGSSKSTMTKADGSFAIEVEDNETFLTFSYIDREPQDVAVSGKNSVEVKLISSKKMLDDIVVVGYGTESKRRLTSSVGSIKPKELELMPATSLSNVIGGRVPGVNVTTVGGRPGTTSNIQIRGASVGPFAGTTAPLYVIDNVISTKEMFDLLDVNEVEDISILKDAAAAAVYGARASNGVVLVKTRTGKKGRPIIQASGTYGVSNEVRRPQFTTAYEHALLINQAIKAGLDPLIPNSNHGIVPIPDNQLQYLKDNPRPSFADAVSRTPTFQRYAVSFSGASDIVDYFVGGNYVGEGGTTPNLNYSKYGLRANVGVKLTKDLKATINTNLTMDDDYQYFWPFDGENISDSYRQMGRRGHWAPAFIDGLPVANFNAFNPANIAANRGTGDRRRTTDLKNFIITLDYNIPFVKGLSAGLTYNNRQLLNINTTWQQPLVDYTFEADPNNPFDLSNKVVGTRVTRFTGVNQNSLAKTSVMDNAYQLNARVNYDRKFGDHGFKAMLIYEQSESKRDQFNGIRRNLISPDVQQLFATSPRLEDRDFTGQQFEVGRLSYIGTVGYSFMNRYYLDASVRYDGSVAFAPGRQYGTFPSVSAGWVISEEKFFQNVKFMNYLKLRGSVGRTGNDNITGGNEYPAYAYLAGYSVQTPANSLVLGDANASNTVINVGGYPSSNATWDKSDMYNLGLDMAFLKNKLTATLEVFRNTRFDMYSQRISIVPVELGSAPPRVNYGELNVQGIEFSANYRDDLGKNGSFNIGFNLGSAKDKITQFDEIPERDLNRQTGFNSDRIFGYIADGVLRSQAQLDKLLASGYTFNNNQPYLGMVLLRDIRGNALADPKGDTPDGKVDANDRTWIANRSTPALNYGFTLGFRYKNLSVEAFAQGFAGFKKLVPATGRFNFDQVSEGGWAWWNDAFEPDTNPNGAMPRFVRSGANGNSIEQASTFWLRDASFARLRNLNVAYTLPQQWSKKAGIRNASVFYNGMNLFFIQSKIKEWDPELQGEGLPINRTHSIGIQLSL
jgi:TonB-linked SusC/RagA family outer membrane protein